MFFEKPNSKDYNPDFLHNGGRASERAHDNSAQKSKINLIVPFVKSERDASDFGGKIAKKLRILFAPQHLPRPRISEIKKTARAKSAVTKGEDTGKKNSSQKGKKQHGERPPIDWKRLTFQQVIQQIAIRIKPSRKSNNRKRLELNLITVEFIDPSQVMRQAVKLGLLALFAVFTVLVSWLILQGTEEKTDQNIQKMKEHIALLERETVQLRQKQKENKIIADRVLTVSALLKNHVYYTKFFQTLEDITRLDVSYEPISIGLKTTYDLSAQTVSVGSLLSQLQAFRHAKDSVKDVSMNSYTVEVQKNEDGENLGSSFRQQRSIVRSLFHIEFDPRIYFKN